MYIYHTFVLLTGAPMVNVISSANARIPATLPRVPRNTPGRTPLAAPIPADASFGQVSPADLGTPGVSISSVQAAAVQALSNGGDAASEIGALAFGPSSNITFSDSRLDGFQDPSNRSGELFVQFSNGWFGCSASLIGNSLLLTAAHCVYSYGANSTTGWVVTMDGQLQVYFAPGYKNGVAPYGTWWAQAITVPRPYYAGTDTCVQRSVVCNNDMALVWLKLGGNTATPQQAGTRLGYNSYGWNRYGFATPVPGHSLFGTLPSCMTTQLGYPVAFDGGNSMQISASPAYNYFTSSTTTARQLKNIQRGTAMTSGSSGSPWIVNYGLDAILSGTTNYGSATRRNVIMGVASYGASDGNIKRQGASFFGQNNEFPNSAYGTRGAGNIGYLVDWACDSIAGWALQSQGMCT